MALSPGTRLGHYDVTSLLGEGGMGQVWQATDTQLKRQVALKILPAHAAADPDRRKRFEREARTISSLDHSQFCALYDIGQQDGVDFLVMQYLEGETLAQRLTQGPLPLDQVLRYAIEIADALDKAHQQGVTHRDLKPANIMLTKAGATLLDFGLAKLTQPGGAAAVSAVPTQSAALTGEGKILGTLQYMAPEQLEGKDADARTDIFAFGAVVFEMVTGNKAFEGTSQASLIGAILKDEPRPMSAVQPLSPAALDRVVKKCLAKDPDGRSHSAHDLHDDLTWIAEAGAQVAVPTSTLAAPQSPSAGRKRLSRSEKLWRPTSTTMAGTRSTCSPSGISRLSSSASGRSGRCSKPWSSGRPGRQAPPWSSGRPGRQAPPWSSGRPGRQAPPWSWPVTRLPTTRRAASRPPVGIWSRGLCGRP